MKIIKLKEIYHQRKWQDNDDGEIYEINFLSYPATVKGKHVYIDSTDGQASYRSLDESKILSFEGSGSHIEMVD